MGGIIHSIDYFLKFYNIEYMNSFERKLIDRQLEKNEFLKDLKEFLIDKLEFLPFSVLDQKSPKELLDLYRQYLNQEANFENFKKFYKEITKKEADKDKLSEYKSYLLGKLPQQLQERHLEISKEQEETDRDFIKRLEEIHKEREKISQRMILGFHCSDINFWKEEGQTFIKAGPRIEVINEKTKTGLHFYSTDLNHLFGPRSKFLYLIEGSTYDIKENKKVQNPYWIYVERDLPVLKVIPITDEIEKELDLKFER